MSAHALVVEAPVSAARRPEQATGNQGRRARRRSDLRAELRAELLFAFSRPIARHRATYIPVSPYDD